MASMLFCRGCSNLLYAKEDKAAKKLMYICQKCQYSQPAENPVVYRHELVRNVTTQLEKIPDAIILDPTLQREAGVVCPSCGSHGAVFVQPKEAPGDTRMKIVNICLNAECVHKWE